jgi:hypothetical protein
MLAPAFLACFWFLQTTPAATPAHHPAGPKSAAPTGLGLSRLPSRPGAVTAAAGSPVERQAGRAAQPRGVPRQSFELKQDLEAALRQAPLARDQFSLAISGQDITLHGAVRSAEDKGVATQLLRHIAAKDGWPNAHVFNQATVDLAPHS